MDPDEALRQIRLLVRQMEVEGQLALGHPGTSTGNFIQHGHDLIEQVEALDGWLTGGGFPPDDWYVKERR
jgi:hypothetical protein